jgi:hypothetical protein
MSVYSVCFEIAADLEGYSDRSILEKNYQSVYKQIISFLYAHPKCKFSFSFSGWQLSYYKQNHPEAIKILGELTGRHQVEVLGGGYYTPVFPLLFPVDRSGQIEKLTSELRATIGKRPRGMALFESIWDPSLVTTMQTCGMEYVQLDSTLIPEAKNLFCPLISSEQGKTLKIIAINNNLMQNESEPEEEWLERIKKTIQKKTEHADNPLITIEYSIEQAKEILTTQFLEKITEISCDEKNNLLISLPQEYIKSADTFVPSYIPAGMDWKIAQWAQKPYTHTENKSRFPVTIHDFLNAYPQSHRLYERMMYISMLVSQSHGDKVRKSAAREKLWEAQSGISYVCSPEGIPAAAKLRQNSFHALNEAERIILECDDCANSVTCYDYNGDGLNEYVCQMEKYNAVISPIAGRITELDVIKSGGNYADSLNRMEQFDSVQDNYERGFFVEHLLETKDQEKYLNGQPTGSGIFSQVKFTEKKFESPRNEIQMEGKGEFSTMQLPVSLRKNYIITPNGFSIQYILKNESPLSLKGIFIVESNFAQTEFMEDKKSQYEGEIIINNTRKFIDCSTKYSTNNGVSVVQINDMIGNTSFVFEPNEDAGFMCNHFTFKRPDGSGKNTDASHTFVLGFLWDVDLSANMEMEKTINLTIIPMKRSKAKK